MAGPADPKLNALLRQGIAACQAGDLANARLALIAALKIDPQSELGWLWLSSALTEPAERRACLKRVLALNPNHAAARDGLAWLDKTFPPGAARPAAPAPKPAPEPPAEEKPAAEPEPAESPALAWSPADDEPEPEPPPAAEEEAGGARPDWLDAALQRAEAASPRPAVEETVAEFHLTDQPRDARAQPDWLQAALHKAEADEPSPDQTPAETQATAADEEQPDWLAAALQTPKKTDPFSPEAVEAAEAAGATPHGAAAQAGPFSQGEAQTASDESGEEVPDWLAEVNKRAGPSALNVSGETMAEIGLDEETPSWLAEVNKTPGQSAPAFAAPAEGGDEAEYSGEAATLAEAAPRAVRHRARLEATACPWCSRPVSGMDLTCPSCNHPLEFDCPECSYSLALDDTACPNCGWAAGDFLQRQAYLQNLGEAYLAKNAANKALPAFRYLAELMPDSVPVHSRLSHVYHLLGRTEQSVAEAERTLELDPVNAEAIERLGRWYIVRGEFEKAAELVDKLNALPARPPRLTHLLGDLEFERRQYPAAFRAYRAALANPDFDPPMLARLNYRLGEMYLVAEDTLSALRAFQAAVATGAEIHEVEQARVRVDQLRPPLPPSATRSASETLRAMAGPVLFVWLTGVVQIGFRLQNLNGAAVVGLFAAVPGSYLLASAVSTPTAIEWRTILGEKGLAAIPLLHAVAGMLGAAIVITSIVLILFGS